MGRLSKTSLSEKRPLIAITGYYVEKTELDPKRLVRGLPGQDWFWLSMDYVRAVENAGGVPLPFPVVSPDAAEAILAAVDGVVFTGGSDIDPSLYGQKPGPRLGRVNPVRDQFELATLKRALTTRKPLLAICRGLQLLNIACGGDLYQDVYQERRADGEESFWHACRQYPKHHAAHTVRLSEGGLLRQVFDAEAISVNSFHHQAVRTVGAGLEVEAVADDGIVEALRVKSAPFALAVQWHPEMMAETDSAQASLFEAFVMAAARHA